MSSVFARRSLLNAVAGGLTTVGGFAVSVLVARLLGVEATGVVAFAAWVITVAMLATDFGIPGALVRYLPSLLGGGEVEQAERLTSHLLRVFLRVVLAALLCFGGAVLYLHFIKGEPFNPVSATDYWDQPLFWLLLALSYVTQSVAAFVGSVLKGRQDYRTLTRLSLFSTLLQVAVSGLGAALFGLTGALLGSTTGALLICFLVFRFLRREEAPTRELRARVRSFALASWGGYVLSAFAASRMEIFFLEHYWSSQEVGLFAVSLTMANLVAQGPTLLTGALLPFVSEARGRGSAEIGQLYATSLRMMALLVFPLCLGTAAVSPQLLPLLFGQHFADSVPIAAVLVVAGLLVALSTIAVTFLAAMEAVRFSLVTGALSAVLTVVVGLALVPSFGAPAAAAGRAFIQAVVTAMFLVVLNRRFGFRAPLRSLFLLLVAAALCGAAAFAVVEAIRAPAALLLAVPAGAVVYVAAVRLLGALPHGDVALIHNGLGGLPRPFDRLAGLLVVLFRTSSA